MRVKIIYDHTEVKGHHPGKDSCTSESKIVTLQDGLDEKALHKAIEDSVPRDSPLASNEFDRYEIIG